jgi:thioredoxin-related protein
MKKILTILITLGLCNFIIGQQLYDVNKDGMLQIKDAVEAAKSQNKHILIQVGGNWCPWCIRFHNFCKNVLSIDSIIKSSYIYVPLNYSRENKNEKALQYLEHPERFGFPVLVILDNNGKRIHTQDSELLEKGNSYDTAKVIKFLKNWTPEALKK